MRALLLATATGCLWALLVTNQTTSERAPYPPSPVIAEISFDFSSRDRRAPGSDNWPITWADDGHQYAAWGDGGGFGGTNSDGRVSLGVARIEGSSDNYRGYNVWGGKNAENPPQFTGKSYGILSAGRTLYMWVTPDSSVEEARLCYSTNHGATWTRADWAFKQSDGFVLPSFCQFGKAYSGARDSYVYIYAVHLQNASVPLGIQKPGEIDLMRVRRDRITDRGAYEFFAGLGTGSRPTWTQDPAKRRPVFQDPNGVGWCVSVSYNAGLRRYLLCTEHAESFQGNLGIFDAPEPWGPWTTVGYYSNWGGFGSTFFWNFSNKWLSAEGRRFTLIFTGTGYNDAWNTVKGAFTTARTDRKGGTR